MDPIKGNIQGVRPFESYTLSELIEEFMRTSLQVNRTADTEENAVHYSMLRTEIDKREKQYSAR
jgi:hypothetical protein